MRSLFFLLLQGFFPFSSASLAPSGEEVCEGHLFRKSQCLAIGCCEFYDDNCWSLVGSDICERGDLTLFREEVCEGHSFGVSQCEELGCCEWKDYECYASVDNATCESLALPPCLDDYADRLNIQPLPSDSPELYKANFCQYTEYFAPNGKPIKIFGQLGVTSLQLYRARSILAFYLENYSCPDLEDGRTCYGKDKTAIANAMANNGAILDMLNGKDGAQGAGQYIDGQPLYAEKVPVEGGNWYMNSNDMHQDAAFKAILRLVHVDGIGIDVKTYKLGAAPDFQALIRAATTTNQPASLTSPGNGVWGKYEPEWVDDLAEEKMLTQEYLASVIDTYYGLLDSHDEGMRGLYKPSNRENMINLDAVGTNVVRSFFSPRLTWMVYLSPELSSDETFIMKFDDMSNSNPPHAYKSRYIDHAYLLGTNDSNLKGNEHNNCLGVNSGTNFVDGVDGLDVLLFRGKKEDYDIIKESHYIFVEDSEEGRDGATFTENVDIFAFSDTAVTFAGADIDHDDEKAVEAVRKCRALVVHYIDDSIADDQAHFSDIFAGLGSGD